MFEDPKVKAEVTARAEAVLGADAIFATNTSTLPITDLAQASARPANFIGIHFFSPVDKMALVEIIKGRETGDLAVAKALDFVRQIRKTPIVVNDARFFYANRCIIPYLNEGMRMVREGVAPALVENAAKLIGMPLGAACNWWMKPRWTWAPRSPRRPARRWATLTRMVTWTRSFSGWSNRADWPQVERGLLCV